MCSSRQKRLVSYFTATASTHMMIIRVEVKLHMTLYHEVEATRLYRGIPPLVAMTASTVSRILSIDRWKNFISSKSRAFFMIFIPCFEGLP